MDLASLRDPRVASKQLLRIHSMGFVQFLLTMQLFTFLFQGWLSDGVHYLFKKIGEWRLSLDPMQFNVFEAMS
jgi:hypothetical protein